MGKRRNPNNPPKDHQFKPGRSGNPGGVAGGKKVSTWLIELGQLAELPDADTLPINGRIALARINDALQPGGDRSTALILDRTEGKLTDIKPLPPAASGEVEATPELREYLEALGRPGVNQEEAEAAYLTALYHKALGANTESEKALYHGALEKGAFYAETMRKLDDIEKEFDS
jgi:hypothetical protein